MSANVPARRHSGGRLAGASLVLAAIAFVAVFSILASTFDYPDILDRPAGEVLPRLRSLGAHGRSVWAVYSLIPLLLIPAAAGAAAFHDAPGRRFLVRVGESCAMLAGMAMMLGLIRWPSFQWELAQAWSGAAVPDRAVLAVVFDGVNTMLGQYVGEFLGELLLNVAFVLFSVAAWQDRRLPRGVAVLGLFAGVVGLVALWRNVTVAVAPVAAFNNGLLPVWLVVWGVSLWRNSADGVVERGAQRAAVVLETPR